MERDRILFQRQRVSTIASIQQQGGVSTVITQQVGGAGDRVGHYQRRYSTSRNRRSSNFSGWTIKTEKKIRFKKMKLFRRRCAIYMTSDENGNSLRPMTILKSKNSARSTSSSEGDVTDLDQPSTSAQLMMPVGQSGFDTRRPPVNSDMGLIPQIDKLI